MLIKLLFTIFILTIVVKNIPFIRKNYKSFMKPRQVSAEILIDNMRKQQVRPLKVEQRYNVVHKRFHDKLKNKEISRVRILAIERYLKDHVYKWEYKDKKFKNNAHCIYHLMKSHSLTKRDFDIINLMIG